MVVKTYSPKASEVTSTWRVIDAQGRVLGRLATEVARLLMGKHKPTYARHMNTGDFVVVVNAANVHVTGKKRRQKMYYRHSGYMGGLRETPLWKMLEEHPERVIQHAVKGMLPGTTLGAQMLKRLKVYPGPEHPHEAQVRGGVRATLRAPRRRAPESKVETPVQAPVEEQPRPPTRTRARAKAKAGAEVKSKAKAEAGVKTKAEAAATKERRGKVKKKAEKKPPQAAQTESQAATTPPEKEER